MSSSSGSGRNIVTVEKLHAFHSMDRQIFSRLVLSLMRDPAESLLIMALWMWLEEFGYPKMVSKMLALSDRLLNGLAEEAARCLRCLDSSTSNATLLRLAPNGVLLLTSRLMQKELSLQMFILNRFTAISGVKNYLTNIISRIFTDILQMILPSSSSVMSHDTNQPQPLLVPGFPHPVFGVLNIIPGSNENFVPTGGIWGWSPSIEVSDDDKTMFLTFSRGFPVTVGEVEELFASIVGVDNCVEMVDMENVPADEQPLYAKMVMKKVKFVDQILQGNRVSKYRINGKHIWARKYERRE